MISTGTRYSTSTNLLRDAWLSFHDMQAPLPDEAADLFELDAAVLGALQTAPDDAAAVDEDEEEDEEDEEDEDDEEDDDEDDEDEDDEDEDDAEDVEEA